MGFFAFFGALMIGGVVGYLSEKWDLTHNGILASIIISLGGVILLFMARVMFGLSFGAPGVDAIIGGAGALLFLSAVALVSGRPALRAVDDHEDIAVVPLAMPVTVGPGTTGALLVLGPDISRSYGGEFWPQAVTVGALLAAVLSVGVMLVIAARADRFLRPRILSVLTKLTGLVLASLAAQLVFTGIRNFMG